MCVCGVFLDRSREATRDRATPIGDCARPTAGCVVAVVVVACVAVVRMWHRLRPTIGEAGGGGGSGGRGGGGGGVRCGGVCAHVAAIALDRRRCVWWRWWWRRVWRWRVCVRACVCVHCYASLLDRAREASRDRATHSSDCARPTARCVVVVVAVAVVPYVVVARVCVCVCVCFASPLDRAREATRDRATHSIDCARPTARCVVAVVVAACVAVACVCVQCFLCLSS